MSLCRAGDTMNRQHQESVIEQNLKILRGVPAFSHLDYDILSLFALVADRKKYSRDEIIFAKGDLLATAFIIIQGEVELLLGPGTSGTAWSAWARAISLATWRSWRKYGPTWGPAPFPIANF